MEITRYMGYESRYNYEFIDENNIFSIAFGGNLDLYWSLKIQEEYQDFTKMSEEIYDTFTITKENYQLYSLFKSLIDEIKSSEVFTPSPEYTLNEDEEIIIYPPTYEEIENTKRRNKELQTHESFKRIIDGDSIVWHSDEESYEIADVLKISEANNNIILEFYRPPLIGEKSGMRRPGTITIRFRNSGSYYHPFNFIFMRMYNRLQEFDPEFDKEYHQIHLEELPYQLKKVNYENSKN